MLKKHVRDVKKVLEILARFGLKLNMKNCMFAEKY
jgi:hypothetical protein